MDVWSPSYDYISCLIRVRQGSWFPVNPLKDPLVIIPGRHKNSRTKKQPEQPEAKIFNTARANNFKTARGQKPKIQPGGKRPKSNKTAGIEKSDLFENKQRSVLSPLPCGRPRPWKIMFFCIYTFFFTLQNCLICLVLSIGSMPVFLVLKNAAECTSQRLKRTSGAWVMIIFHAGPMYRKTAGQKTSQRL